MLLLQYTALPWTTHDFTTFPDMLPQVGQEKGKIATLLQSDIPSSLASLIWQPQSALHCRTNSLYTLLEVAMTNAMAARNGRQEGDREIKSDSATTEPNCARSFSSTIASWLVHCQP